MSACRICSDPRRAEIDAALIARIDARTVARTYGLSKTGVHRHLSNHLRAELAIATEGRVELNGDLLVERIESLYSKAYAVLEGAERAEKPSLMLAAIKEARGTLETVGRLLALVQAEKRIRIAESQEPGLMIRFPEGFLDAVAPKAPKAPKAPEETNPFAGASLLGGSSPLTTVGQAAGQAGQSGTAPIEPPPPPSAQDTAQARLRSWKARSLRESEREDDAGGPPVVHPAFRLVNRGI